jgi:hypothetical protein
MSAAAQLARVEDILGAGFSIFGFDTAAAATAAACLKMDAGREALTFAADGVHFAAWGLKT